MKENKVTKLNDKNERVLNRKAISLAVLAITIVIILILAGAIIFNLRKSNSINLANEATLKSDLQSIKDEYKIKYDDLLYQYRGQKDKITKEDLEDIVPEEYKPDFIILPEGPAYVGEDPEIKEIAEEMEYIIGYPSDKIEIEYVNLDSTVDTITVEIGIKETQLEIKNIEYYISEDGENWEKIDSTELTNVFPGLKENTIYKIKVVVTDENDETDESDIYEIRTKEREFEAGEIELRKTDENGEEYVSGEWTKEDIYIKLKEDGLDTSYEVYGANEVEKGTKEPTVITNSGVSKIRVTTKKNEKTKTREYEVKIDKDAPEITNLISENTEPTNQNVTITGKAIDRLSGIVAYMYSENGELDENAEGWENIEKTSNGITREKEIEKNGTYYFYVKDTAGNVAKKEIVVNNIDKTAPILESINVTSPATAIYKAGQEVTIVATYSENIKGTAPVLKIKFGTGEERTAISGSVSSNKIIYTYTIASGDNGILVSTSYTGSVTDLVGNELEVTNKILGGNEITADTVPPTNTVPTLIATTNSITATFKQTDILSGINNETIMYAIKKKTDNNWGEWIKDSNSTHIFENLEMNTEFQVKTKVSDNAGNETESEVATIRTINLTKPTISAPTDWTNKDVVVTISYPEIEGTTRQYSTNGTNWTNVTNLTQTITVSENNTTIYARVIDATNQTSGNATYKVTNIDKVLPTVEIGTNGGTYTIPVGSSTINISTTLTASDSGGSALNLLQYQLTTQETVPADNDTNWKTFVNGDSITEAKAGGTYYLYTKVTDRAGNRATSIQKSNSYTVRYIVKFNANEGSGAPEDQIKVNNTNLTLSSTVPTRTGYTFVGWNTNKSATQAEYTAGGIYSANASAQLYAIWSINSYTATFDSNGGTTANPATITKNYNAQLGTLPTSTKTNYLLDGWYSAKTGGTKIATTTTMPANNVTYYAHWTPNPSVTITQNPTATTVVAGNSFTFSVTATGNGTLSYQWYYNTSNSTTGGTSISGATSASYTATSTTALNGRYYYCVVTSNVDGSTKSATSSTALLTVQTANYSTVKSGVTTYYNTLEAAGAGATSNGGDTGGGTITVLQNVTDDSDVNMTKNITLNTNAKTITRSSSITILSGTFKVNGTGKISSDITAGSTFYLGGTGAIEVSGSPTLESLDRCVIETTGTGAITVAGGTLKAARNVIFNEGTATIKISGGTVTGPETGNYPVIYNALDGGNVIVSGGSITSPMSNAIYNNSGGSIEISGSPTITSVNSVAVYNNFNGTITVNGGNISSTNNTAIKNNGTGSITVNSGTIKALKGNVINNSGLGYVRINAGTIIGCETGTTPAIWNSTDEGTIIITGGDISCTSSTTIYNKSNGNIEISGNPNISSTNSTSISNIGNGNVTVSGGNITSLNGNVITNKGAGTVRISGCTITGCNTETYPAIWNETDQGKIIIAGGKFSSETAPLIYNKSAGSIEISGNPTLKTTSSNTIRNMGAGTITMTGGTINSKTSNAIFNKGTVRISGCTITGCETGTTPAIWNETDTGKVIVSSGNISCTSSSTIYNKAGGSVEVSGNSNINSTDSAAIKNNGTGTVTINGGMISSTNSVAVFSYSTGIITLNNGTIKSLKSNVLNNKGDGTVNIKGGNVIGCQEGSYPAIWNETNAGVINVTGGNITSETSTLLYNKTGGSINISGNPTITTNDSNAITNVSTGIVTILSGNITCPSSYVAVLNRSTGTITVGRASDAISVTNPCISGGNSVKNSTGTFNFYNGILRGTGAAHSGTINGKRTDATITKGTSGVYNTEYYQRSISVPTLTPSTKSWTNKNVIVSIQYPSVTGTTKEYSTNGTTWSTTTETIKEVTVSANNTTVYARVKDNTTGQYGSTVSYKVTNIDKIAPTADQPTITDMSSSNVSVQVKNVADSLSGIDRVEFYEVQSERFIGSVSSASGTINFDCRGFTLFNQIEMEVKIFDKAGNSTSKFLYSYLDYFMEIRNVTRSGFDVYAYFGDSNITNVRFPVWTTYNGQDDILWYSAQKIDSRGIWYKHVYTADHWCQAETYRVHCYYYESGTNTYLDGKDTYVPISNHYGITNISSTGYDAYLYVNSNSVSRTEFPTWTESNGQDDIIWGQGTNKFGYIWHYRVNVSDHGYQNGQYNTHFYAWLNGVNTKIGGSSCTISGASGPSVPAHTCNTNGYCNVVHKVSTSYNYSTFKCSNTSHGSHPNYRHPMCTVCGKINQSSYKFKCPNSPAGTQMTCPNPGA